jgi:ribonuclease BN (tRNA processing enzyme)
MERRATNSIRNMWRVTKAVSHPPTIGDNMVEVRFLGSGNAFCPEGRLHSLVLIDGQILIDAPPTILYQLQRAGLSPSDINTLLITHWHGDHIFNFPFFILERKYISDREGKNIVNVHLHKGGNERFCNISELAFPETLADVLQNNVRFHNSPTGLVEGVQEWQYERFEVNHVPVTDPHGYQLTHTSGFTIIHCGDSGPCEEIEKRSSEVDVVIIEVGIPDGVPTEMHFKPSSLRELAEKNPQTIFLATHLFTSNNEIISELPSNVIQVSDGDRFSWEDGQLLQISN